jgi:D-alanyl-lipoteichoic acid acyltransferase DltB (MBOAT superfamily)
MLLDSPAYLLFLGVVVVLYWLVPRGRWRKYILLVASYIFYALFDLRFAVLLLGLTAINFWLGEAIYAAPDDQNQQNQRRWPFLWVGIILNLGVLGFFKYSNFFLDSLSQSLHLLGIAATPPVLDLLLPIGISFYTFQAISYLVQINNRKLVPSHNVIDLAVYLAFFPKLIAGPLIRPETFFTMIENPTIDRKTGRQALGLILLGLFKKVLIADSLASIADVAYRAAVLPQGAAFPTLLYWQGFYLYAFQIYADFSGYTDIARGSAMLLGIKLPENFDAPYLASIIGDFWNRWHISLTLWFRENLFFPLTRNLLKRSNGDYARTVQVCSTLVTMILIGLWHGAAWTFILWGLWHGILLSIERLTNFRPKGQWQVLAGTIITFHLVAIGWVLFRAPSLESAGTFFSGLFSLNQLSLWAIYLPPILFVGVLIFILEAVKRGRLRIPESLLPAIIACMLAVVIGLILLSAARGNDVHPFIYGHF